MVKASDLVQLSSTISSNHQATVFSTSRRAKMVAARGELDTIVDSTARESLDRADNWSWPTHPPASIPTSIPRQGSGSNNVVLHFLQIQVSYGEPSTQGTLAEAIFAGKTGQ